MELEQQPSDFTKRRKVLNVFAIASLVMGPLIGILVAISPGGSIEDVIAPYRGMIGQVVTPWEALIFGDGVFPILAVLFGGIGALKYGSRLCAFCAGMAVMLFLIRLVYLHTSGLI